MFSISRNRLTVTLLSLIIIAAISSCQNEEDITPPVITLSGDNPLYMELNADYVEPGFKVTDNEDGTIANSSVSILSNVQKDQSGSYSVTYSVTDNAGNAGVAERRVIVRNAVEFLGGIYTDADNSCQNTTSTLFTAEIIPSETENNKFAVKNFGGFGEAVYIQCSYDPSSSSITAVAGQSLGGSVILERVNIAGVTNHASPIEFFINYSWLDGAIGNVCNSTYSN